MKKRIKKGQVIRDFIYPVLNDENRQYGASILQAPILRPDADWRMKVPPYEAQERAGIEPGDCYVEAQQHTIASIHEQKFGEIDNNWDAWFNALLSNGTPTGGDPIKGADSIRHDGLIPEGLKNWNEVKTWDDFHSWKGADESRCRAAGDADVYLYDRRFGAVIQRGFPIATKYQIFKEGLKRSPVPFSIFAVSDGKGSYIEKPKGANDTHMVEGLYVSPDNKITYLDTYPPYIKETPPNYDMDFGMVWTVDKKAELKKNWYDGLVAFLNAFLEPKDSQEVIKKLEPVLLEKPMEPKYKWGTVEEARHSVRVIADEEGLSVSDKNLICQVIRCESGFKNTAKNDNKDKNGKVLSVDYGICQINDYWHIGKNKTFPSVQYVLENPDKVVRWMIGRFKAGKLNLWVCYSKGMYKNYKA